MNDTAMRVAIVGGGIAGSLLAWRLATRSRTTTVDVFLRAHQANTDATGASGGLVRAFEADPEAGRLAAESLAELVGSAALREWSGYHQVGSVYLTDSLADPAAALRSIEDLLPRSAIAATGRELTRRFPFRGLPPDAVGIFERTAGYLSPARLRAAALTAAVAAGARVHDRAVTEATMTPAIRLADGTERWFDVVVVAAGAWSAHLLATAGAHPGMLRTKRIQYCLRAGCPSGLGAFVDETSGLYGRPTADGGLLIGLPSDDWDLDPRAVVPDPQLADRVTTWGRRRFGAAVGGVPATRTVASVDCYADPPGLFLRPTTPGSPLFSFTGGSGGAAKTALAASGQAANQLLQLAPAA